MIVGLVGNVQQHGVGSTRIKLGKQMNFNWQISNNGQGHAGRPGGKNKRYCFL